MKVGQGQRGSMGIPPEMIENQKRFEAQRDAKEKRTEGGDTPPPPEQPEPINDPGFAPAAGDEKKSDAEMVAQTSPMKVLKDMGLDFTDDDLQNLLFKGFYEANVEIVKGKFKAKIKTLTVAEYDEVDELLGEDLKEKEMTNNGFEARRSMWIVSYGVTELAGRPLCKPVKNKDGSIDTKATAKEKRKVLGALSSMLVNRMIQIHGTITTAVSLIGQDPDVLKNS